jgi:DNA gyrase subunit A
MRVVVEIKRDAIANVVLNKLYKFSSLQTSFSVNNICLVEGRPRLLNLREIIDQFILFRHDVVVRRTRYELRKAEERAHILEGLIIASDNIDEVIEIIKTSDSPDHARERLSDRFGLSEIQTRAIVDMRLRQLTGLEQDKLRSEFEELMKLIADLKDILDREERRMQIIKDELIEIKAKYGDARRSSIEYAASEMRMEDLIADEEVVVTISHAGYIKRTNLNEYKVQNRGGMGSKGSTTRDKDFLEHLFVATNHNYLLIFTEKGRCFWMRVYEIPEGNKL